MSNTILLSLTLIKTMKDKTDVRRQLQLTNLDDRRYCHSNLETFTLG